MLEFLDKKNRDLLFKSESQLYHLISGGNLGRDAVQAINRAMNAARNQGFTHGKISAATTVLLSHPAKPAPHPGFHVWNPEGPYGGRPTYTHYDLDSAVTEAKRLAVQVPDKRFYVMAPIAAALSERTILPVTLSLVENKAEADDDGIPF